MKAGKFTRYPALSAVLAGADLKFVDIGGRGEAFPGLPALAEFSGYYVSEPDTAEASRLREQLPLAANWRSVTVFSDAIAARHGDSTLYVTRRPGMSSLLEPDPAVAGQFYLADAYEVVDEIQVPTMTLDAAATRYGFENAAFLKMDTQGTELEILRSGSRLVRDSLVAIHTEAHFRPFYKGQPAFGDIDGHLRANGFVLSSLNRTAVRRRGYDESVFSRRVTTWAHCLYFLEPAQLLARGAPTAARDMVRLMAIALALRHIDLALEVMASLVKHGLLAGEDHHTVASDVREAAIEATRYAQRKAEEQGSAEGLLDAARRDSRRID